MKKILLSASALCLLATAPFAVNAGTPSDDLKQFRAHYQARHPDTPMDDYINGVYSVDPASRAQWEEIEDGFPPYEIGIEKGEELYNTKFANGKGYADCFGGSADGAVKQNYPFFDTKTGNLVTLEGAINKCRVDNAEKPLKYKKGAIAQIGAYMAYNSRGKTINVSIPDDKRALDIYNRGKKHFYAKRGQLNMSCADCHFYNSGNRIRAENLSPALGQPSGFPVYRSKWGSLGTLHRRYGGCNKQVRAKPFKAQSDEYKALEYFHTYMSNGLKWNGPSSRK